MKYKYVFRLHVTVETDKPIPNLDDVSFGGLGGEVKIVDHITKQVRVPDWHTDFVIEE